MLLDPRSLSRIACLASLCLAGCSGLSDLDAEFTGGLPDGAGSGGRAAAGGAAGGAIGGAAGTRGGAAGSGAGAGSNPGGRAGASGSVAGASGQTAGGASGQAGASAGSGGVSASGAAGAAGAGNGGNASGSGGSVGGAAGGGGKVEKGGAGGAMVGGGAAGEGGGGGFATAGNAGDGGAAGAAGGGAGDGGTGGASSGSGGSETGGAAGSDLGGSSGAGGGGKAGASGAGTGGTGGSGGSGATSSAGTGGSGANTGSSGNAGQAGAGGSCTNDVDCDGITTSNDNCVDVANTAQSDQDSDKIGDACDPTPGGADATTNWESCGASAGAPAVELTSVPTFSCTGSPFAVSFRAGGAISCGSKVEFRAYRKVLGRLTALGKMGEASTQSGSVTLIGAVGLSPGEWYLEATVGNVASERKRVMIGGAQVSVTLARQATIEGGNIPITFSTTPSDPLTQYTMRLDGGPASAVSSPSAVAFAVPGDHEVTISAKTPDGCTTSSTGDIEMFTCHPVLPASTVLAPAPGNTKSVLVCGGASHTTTSGSNRVYARPGATIGGGNGISVVWLSAGATIAPPQGILTLLYTGTQPALSGSVRYLSCDDISFDEAAVSPTCPVP